MQPRQGGLQLISLVLVEQQLHCSHLAVAAVSWVVLLIVRAEGLLEMGAAKVCLVAAESWRELQQSRVRDVRCWVAPDVEMF